MGYTSSFKDGVVYSVDALNDMVLGIYTPGVGFGENSLKVSVDGTKVTIAAGRAIMNDGSTFVVDSDETTLTRTTTSTNYVYVLNDPNQFANVPKCTTTMPTSGDYIMLAEITAAGKVTDKRETSMGLASMYQGGAFVLGTYTGNGAYVDAMQNINLGFKPALVIATILSSSWTGVPYWGIAFGNVHTANAIEIADNGFNVYRRSSDSLNYNGYQHAYIAFRNENKNII